MLKLEQRMDFRNPAVIYLIDPNQYTEVGYHDQEIARIRREASIARVIAFNSLDNLERKRRFIAHEKLMKEYKAIPKRGPALRAGYEAKLRLIIPDGITVSPHRDYFAAQKRGWR